MGSRAIRLALTAASTGLVLAGVICFVAAAWLGQRAERRSR
jgi:Na+/glutamate symporter